jgi:hypothetical protein
MFAKKDGELRKMVALCTTGAETKSRAASTYLEARQGRKLTGFSGF